MIRDCTEQNVSANVKLIKCEPHRCPEERKSVGIIDVWTTDPDSRPRKKHNELIRYTNTIKDARKNCEINSGVKYNQDVAARLFRFLFIYSSKKRFEFCYAINKGK